MERLLELGGDKKYLTFDDLNRELPDNVVSPDDIEDVLQKLEGSNIAVADSDERLLEQAAAVASEDEDVSGGSPARTIPGRPRAASGASATRSSDGCARDVGPAR